MRAQLGTASLAGVGGSPVKVGLRRAVLHPQYNPGILDFDVAVLELARPLGFNPFIQPVCLPLAIQKFPVGRRCVVSGWGSTQEGNGELRPHAWSPVCRPLASPLLRGPWTPAHGPAHSLTAVLGLSCRKSLGSLVLGPSERPELPQLVPALKPQNGRPASHLGRWGECRGRWGGPGSASLSPRDLAGIPAPLRVRPRAGDGASPRGCCWLNGVWGALLSSQPPSPTSCRERLWAS